MQINQSILFSLVFTQVNKGAGFEKPASYQIVQIQTTFLSDSASTEHNSNTIMV